MSVETRMLRLEDALSRLAEAQVRTEERMEQVEAALARLAEAQAHTEERVGRLEERMEQVEAALLRLTEAQVRTEGQLEALVSWQRGEAGRREGERYERDVVRRAAVLFNGGRGGSPDQSEIQRRLARLLRPLLAQDILAAEADPSLADLLWWKGDRLAVVEIAIQVNGEDIGRAVQRAETLRHGGAQVSPVVIGESWATLDTRERARTLGVDWKVGADLSEGFLAFRRLHSEEGHDIG